MRAFSFIVLLLLAGCSTVPVDATAAQACGYGTTARWQLLPMTDRESRRLLSLVIPLDALRFSPERAEAWFSNGFDEIVLCQYRVGIRAPCDAEILTVDYIKQNEKWSAGPVEKQICVN